MPKDVIRKIVSMSHHHHDHTFHVPTHKRHKPSVIRSLLFCGGHIFHEGFEKDGSHHPHRDIKAQPSGESAR